MAKSSGWQTVALMFRCGGIGFLYATAMIMAGCAKTESPSSNRDCPTLRDEEGGNTGSLDGRSQLQTWAPESRLGQKVDDAGGAMASFDLDRLRAELQRSDAKATHRDKLSKEVRSGPVSLTPAQMESAGWSSSWARIGDRKSATRLIDAIRQSHSADPKSPFVLATKSRLAWLEADVFADGYALSKRGQTPLGWRHDQEEQSSQGPDHEVWLWLQYGLALTAEEARLWIFNLARLGAEFTRDRLVAELHTLTLTGSSDESIGSSFGEPGSRGRFPASPYPKQIGDGFEALAILCSRGFALEKAGSELLLTGLASPHVSTLQGALHAWSRCAATSTNSFAREDEGQKLQKLLTRAREHRDDEVRRLAWKASANPDLELEQIPAEILARSGFAPWLIEVEAVRALANHRWGRQTLVDRLLQLEMIAFAGARQHVLFESLRSLRAKLVRQDERNEGIDRLGERLKNAATQAEGRLAKVLGRAYCELVAIQSRFGGSRAAILECANGSNSTIEERWIRRLHFETTIRAAIDLHDRQAIDAVFRQAADLGPLKSHDQPEAKNLNQGLEQVQPGLSAKPLTVMALAALADLHDSRVPAMLRKALTVRDAGVASAAASAIAARSLDVSRRDPSAVEPLLALLDDWSNGEAIEARLAGIEALGRLASQRVLKKPERASELATRRIQVRAQSRLQALADDGHFAVRSAARSAMDLDPDPNPDPGAEAASIEGTEFGESEFAPFLFRAVQGFQKEDQNRSIYGLQVHTDMGTFDIDFRGVDAPINQINLLKLASEGYYRGLSWHRVVPGFVIQGGDPRGDGYGGPGYIVPCERSSLRFVRGTVGIALAGKDTGGSQIFVTQSRQPHLDGKYTVVGHVTRGMDVVERIMAGDSILQVDLLRDSP